METGLPPNRRIPSFEACNLAEIKESPQSRKIAGIFLLVEVSGFEPEVSWTRTKRDTKLRHTSLALLL